MACHIYAAADGPAARRTGRSKSIDELRSIENGIWMCYRHGKLIDTDECSYTPQLLSDWRRLAEHRARLRHELGRELSSDDMSGEALAKVAIAIYVPELTREITEAIQVSDLSGVWGAQTALAVRDFVIEIGRNAMTHGRANSFQLTIAAHTVVLSDDGAPFSLENLLASGSPRGGTTSLKQMQKRLPNLVVSYARQEARNVITIASTSAIDEMLSTNPCTTDFFGAMSSVRAAMEFIETRPECGTIFLRPRWGSLSYSDLGSLAWAIDAYGFRQRDIALILEPHSEGILEVIAETMPNVRVIKIRH
ncbi:hypothetical protein QA639_19035 [Bradyrhizobium pachyrhizi]|uniref:hypothetical protein n=1 Tax=Bradyrhizobium pachyrhizi TaxID=280333 RepID=UPI0024B0F40F|nr:hypothetical protein [Bradyrhizobium pachyrhizi]WFU59479.1 hypothetical protein QA639_19035 [Bradyrhizobium pachyrhizi]